MRKEESNGESAKVQSRDESASRIVVKYRCANDEHWTMSEIDQEIFELSGFPASEFLHNSVRTYSSIIHPEDRNRVEQTICEAVSAKREYRIEYRIRRVDGDELKVFERGRGIYVEPGDVPLFLEGSISDGPP